MADAAVANWLYSLGLGDCIPMFERECIDSAAILGLDDNAFADLGVTRAGHKAKLIMLAKEHGAWKQTLSLAHSWDGRGSGMMPSGGMTHHDNLGHMGTMGNVPSPSGRMQPHSSQTDTISYPVAQRSSYTSVQDQTGSSMVMSSSMGMSGSMGMNSGMAMNNSMDNPQMRMPPSSDARGSSSIFNFYSPRMSTADSGQYQEVNSFHQTRQNNSFSYSGQGRMMETIPDFGQSSAISMLPDLPGDFPDSDGAKKPRKKRDSKLRSKCKHGKAKWYCKYPECGGGGAYCKHGKRKAYCRDPSCEGGSALCKHGKFKAFCPDPLCGGGHMLCKHGKQKPQCRDPECGGGTAYCQHGKHKSECPDPCCGGGTALCKHLKRRALCRDPECGGGQAYCQHGKMKKYCRDPLCGGGDAYCKHGICKTGCRDPECGSGSAFCMHGGRKTTCKVPGCGTLICKHGRAKFFCRDPGCGGGGAYCIHNKERRYCAEPMCEGGSALCPHGRRKNRCKGDLCSVTPIRKVSAKDAAAAAAAAASSAAAAAVTAEESPTGKAGLGAGAASGDPGVTPRLRPCPHGVQLWQCKEVGCGPVCRHRRGEFFPNCRDGECQSGKALCPHGKRRRFCQDCSPLSTLASSGGDLMGVGGGLPPTTYVHGIKMEALTAAFS